MIRQYRNGEFIRNIEPIRAQLTWRLMGPFVLEIEVPPELDFSLKDLLKIEYAGQTYTFRVHSIEHGKVKAEHISYVLQERVMVDKYINYPASYDDLIEFVDISFSDLITQVLHPLLQDAGFEAVNNTTKGSTRKDIRFTQDTLYSALQKVCETYGVEFEVNDTQVIFKDQVGIQHDIEIVAGVHASSVTRRVDMSDVVTRIYPVGSSQNLPLGYYYTALRPTTFDVNTLTHTGNMYIDNPTAQQKYGIIEKIVEFAEIKPESFRGTIQATGTGYLEEYKHEFPYIEDARIRNVDAEKVKKCTLFIQKELSAAEVPIMAVDTDRGRIYYSPYLEDGTQLSWAPVAGSEYIILGYITQEEMNRARDQLIDAAQRYLAEHAEPRIDYSITDVYLPNHDIKPGDALLVRDDLYEFYSFVRCVEIEKDLLTNIYQLSLSTIYEPIPYVLGREVADLKEEIKLLKSDQRSVTRTAMFTPVQQIVQQPAPGVQRPDPPSNLQLSWGQDQLGVYIVAQWQGVEGVSTYRVRYSYDGYVFTYLPDVSTTTVQFYVSPATVVHVEVAAVGEAGTISSYLSGSIQVGGSIITAAPTIKSVVGIFTSVQVSYEFPLDKLSLVDAFEVQVDTSSAFSNPKSFHVQGLVATVDVPELLVGNETTVYVRVRTLSQTGHTSAWSATRSTKIFKVKGEYIAEATIDSLHVKTGAIKTAHIGDLQVTNAKIASIDASKITTGYLSADRIAAGSITVDKLAAQLWLKGKEIIAGSEERAFIMNEKGLFRRIKRGGNTFESEVNAVIYQELLTIPSSGYVDFSLPSPLTLDDVDVVVVPLRVPVYRSGLDPNKSYDFRLNVNRLSATQVRITSHVAETTTPVYLWQNFLLPTPYDATKNSNPNGVTEKVDVSIVVKFLFNQVSYPITKLIDPPKNVPVKLRCWAQGLTWYWEVTIDKNVWQGSAVTPVGGIWATVVAWNSSTSPRMYAVPSSVYVLLIDKRDYKSV